MVACPEGHRGREVAAGAVAADGEARGVDADRRAVGGHPFQRGHHIVEGAGKARLGCQAIVDMEHRNAGLDRELGAEHVVAVEVAEHPAAAMRIDHRRQRGVGGGRCRAVEANGNIPRRAGNRAIHHRHLGGARALRTGAQRKVEIAGGLRTERVPGRSVGGRHQVDQPLGFRIESHSTHSIENILRTLAACAPVSSRGEW
jgi:hypothetical protein